MIMRRTLVIAALALAIATPTLAQMKEGTFSVTVSSAGTFKATAIGKERLLSAWDESGLTVGNGFLDHATWHCFGLYDVMNGRAQWQGRCVATDPAGDQVVSNVASDGKYLADAKSYNGTGTFTTGTGKYAGISGGWTFVGHSPEFRTAAPESTYVQYGSLQGSYKIVPEATGSTAPPATAPTK
jgi:hypothetical protein